MTLKKCREQLEDPCCRILQCTQGNDIVDAGPTVCSMLDAEKTFIEKNHDMAVVMAMAEGAVYKGEPILVKALEEAIINEKKKKKLFTKAGFLKDEIK